MPQTQTYTTYKFNELSDKAKAKAIDYFRYSNTDHYWYDSIYEDAKQIGLEINSFDCYRKDIEGELIKPIKDIIKAICENHGKECDTYKLAKEWEEKLYISKANFTMLGQAKCFACGYDSERYPINEYGYCEEACFEGEFETPFKEELLKTYLDILEKDYDYLNSDEAVIETIESNDYDFLEDGTYDK